MKTRHKRHQALLMKPVTHVLLLIIFTLLLCTSCSMDNDPVLDASALAVDAPMKKVAVYMEDRSDDFPGNTNTPPIQPMLSSYPEHIIYDYWSETMKQEGYIEKGLSLLDDEQVVVYILYPAYPHYEELLSKIKEKRPDVFCIAIEYDYNSNLRATADHVLGIDYETMAEKMVAQSQIMGADTFVYYASTQSQYNAYEYKDAFQNACEKLGLGYIEEVDLGMISASLPERICADAEQKSKESEGNISIFSDVCSFNPRLFLAAIDSDNIITQSCHPSIYHALVWTVGAEYVDSELDFQRQIELVRSEIAERGAAGRLACWPVPYDLLALTAALEYSIGYINPDTEAESSVDAWRGYFDRALETLGADDVSIELRQQPDFANCIVFTENYIVL